MQINSYHTSPKDMDTLTTWDHSKFSKQQLSIFTVAHIHLLDWDRSHET